MFSSHYAMLTSAFLNEDENNLVGVNNLLSSQILFHSNAGSE